MMVRSTHLTPNAITAAVKRGDFYNSTGVTLRSLVITDDHIELEIEPQDNARYRIEFIGTPAGYQVRGDELYVRARITS